MKSWVSDTISRALIFGLMLVSMVAIVGLHGCSLQQVKANVEQKVASDLAKAVSPVAIPDLQNQVAEALANNPPDTEGANCGNATIQLLTDLSKAAPSSSAKCAPYEFMDPKTQTCKLGAASALEAQRLAATTPVQSFKLPAYWIKGCAVVVHDANLTFLQFLGQLGISLAPVAGELKVIQGAGALKAEAAALQAAKP